MDLPAGDRDAPVLRVLGAERGGGARVSVKEGWGMVAGLSAWEMAVDEPPLSNFNVSRPSSTNRGDGAWLDPSASPASGESRARCLPLLITWPIRNS